MITIVNCKSYLEALGIYMEQTGAGELLAERLSAKLTYLSWEYYFRQEMLIIYVEEGTEIPDLSEFGEVLPNDNSMG
jgi:hypothetical protein